MPGANQGRGTGGEPSGIGAQNGNRKLDGETARFRPVREKIQLGGATEKTPKAQGPGCQEGFTTNSLPWRRVLTWDRFFGRVKVRRSVYKKGPGHRLRERWRGEQSTSVYDQ